MFEDIENLPKAVVFDLDETLWDREVDCSGGPPFSLARDSRKTIICSRKTPIHLYDDVPTIFDSLADDGRIKVGYASRTWEPEWAKAALRQVPCGSDGVVNMWSLSSASGWGDHSKVSHLKTVSSQMGIPLKSIVFYDNEMRNIRDVKPMGVFCSYCPDGLDAKYFMDSLVEYSDAVRRN
jgi:magnesium-dependent phosphatase-1